ncbi:MAG: integrase, partial [Acidimicrobiaceae bacterium]|nr:integrase [Acidimicrobiaceae bacterium]
MKGTIRVRVNKDGSTSYVCQVKLGRDPGTGKQRVLTGTAKSERAAHRLVHELLARSDDRSQHASDATVATVIEQWLATGGPAGEATRQVYAGYIRLHVLPTLGAVPLRKLGVADLERWYAALRDKGLSPASIRKAHTIVRAALAQAVRWGWAPTNVAALARPPLVPKAVIATPKPSAVRRMLAVAREHDPDLAVYLHLAAVTGARPGEMCGLRWADIDVERGELRIARRILEVQPEPKVQDLTKTGKTRRIPLDPAVIGVLARLRSERESVAQMCRVELSPDAYVFSDTVDGTGFWRPDSTSRRFRKLRMDHELDDVTLYSLRHQAATTMIDSGVDAKTVSERLGNSVATVLGTY